MRYGCCGSMVAQEPDGTGVEIVEQLAEIGYDYIELSLAHLMALPEAEFQALAGRVRRSGIPCEACNNFFPPRVRLTGSQVDWTQVKAYTAAAIERAASLGVRVIVFGSSGAKNVPEGFPKDRAWEQIVDVLRMAGPLAGEHGITIAIEPLNRRESNIVNTVAEGLTLARQASSPHVRLLVDYYHLALEGEDPAIVAAARDQVAHVHFARVEGRSFPTTIEASYEPFFANLRSIGYEARVSVEAYSQDFRSDAVQALAVLRRLAQGEEAPGSCSGR